MLGRRQRIGGRRSRQFRLPAQEIAQNAIDQAAKLAVRHLPGSRNRLIDHGMHRIRARFQAIDGDQQQGAHLVDRQRLVEQAGEEEIAPAVGAQAAIDKILHGRPGDRSTRPSRPSARLCPANTAASMRAACQQA
jgi:hypothetical protein